MRSLVHLFDLEPKPTGLCQNCLLHSFDGVSELRRTITGKYSSLRNSSRMPSVEKGRLPDT